MTDKETLNDFILMKLVWENSSLAGYEKLVALGLARRYSSKDGYSKYSIRKLAADAGISVSSVQKIIPRILESGEWEAIGSGTRAGKYAPVLAKLSAKNERMESPRKKEYDVSLNLLSEGGEAPDYGEQDVAETSSLPLYLRDEPMNSGNIAPFIKLAGYKQYASRLHKRTDITTRGRKDEFNVANLTAMYSRFHKAGYELEAIDTLLTYQCDNALALSDGFLRAVLGRMTKNGRTVEPKTFKADPEEDKIYLTAKVIWDIMEARTIPADDSEQYSSSL
jgi:hypothetical protein